MSFAAPRVGASRSRQRTVPDECPGRVGGCREVFLVCRSDDPGDSLGNRARSWLHAGPGCRSSHRCSTIAASSASHGVPGHTSRTAAKKPRAPSPPRPAPASPATTRPAARSTSAGRFAPARPRHVLAGQVHLCVTLPGSDSGRRSGRFDLRDRPPVLGGSHRGRARSSAAVDATGDGGRGSALFASPAVRGRKPRWCHECREGPGWWTRSQRLRTLAALPVQVEVRAPPKIPVYQRIGAEAAEMQARGVPIAAIARHLRVDHHTVEKAIWWFRGR